MPACAAISYMETPGPSSCTASRAARTSSRRRRARCRSQRELRPSRTAGGTSLVFSGDTGESREVVALAEGADEPRAQELLDEVMAAANA